jgi:hypothetical protein
VTVFIPPGPPLPPDASAFGPTVTFSVVVRWAKVQSGSVFAERLPEVG